MELEILKLIYDYSVARKLVDINFIKKLIEIIVTERNLNNYVSDLVIAYDLGENEVAHYDFIAKTIAINCNKVEEIMDRRERYEYLFNDLEIYMFRNMQLTQFILHELEHAYQSKQADDESDNSIEAKLIRICFEFFRNIKDKKNITENDLADLIIASFREKDLYKQYYEFNPSERFAQINSFRILVDSLKSIKEYIPNLCEFQDASLVESMLQGHKESWYDGGICPTQVYLFGTGHENTWYEIDDSEQFDLAKRLTLGLKVSYDEYQSTVDWLETTNKYN